jgi:hypothetical protein
MAAQAQPGLRGVVTDPSGAAIRGAVVELRGPGGVRRTLTGGSGEYSFASLRRGKYEFGAAAKGFATAQRKELAIERPVTLDCRLAIRTEEQVITVNGELSGLSGDPASNAGAVVMGQRQIGALSDDPEEFARQLQALAGPAPGPNGGEMFIDGFTGRNLPPKSQIREVRINANPFSPEYDRPGFSRIEVSTKPGSGEWHGQGLAQFNDAVLNSRNPLLTQSDRPSYGARLFGLDLTGPLARRKASFALGIERRRIEENAIILATTLDAGMNPATVNESLPAPQSRLAASPRADYAIGSKTTLAARYQILRIALENQGAGDFNLASRAYDERQSDQLAQVTLTEAMSARSLNETRFQFQRAAQRNSGGSAEPAINVQGAFYGGGASAGGSGSASAGWELANLSTHTRGRQTWKWGGRLRQSRLRDTSLNNFSGTFTFFTLELYRRTRILEAAGYSGEQIAAMGAGPSQFSLNAGTPDSTVSQSDAGLFVNNDWRPRANVTVSLGVRYEAQTNLGGRRDWAPRAGIAWGLGGRSPKTIVRAGAGTFYERLAPALRLDALRYDGVTQQSYLISNPKFFPLIPGAAALAANRQPQQLRPVHRGIDAPRLYQASAGVERQMGSGSRVSVNWIHTRGVHLLNARNINTPVGGNYPAGDRSVRLLTESAGFSRLNQVVASTNVSRGKLYLFGFYSLGYGKDDNGGLPADPYNLRAEWGPSGYGDVRHRMALGTSIPLPRKFSASPFLAVNSGVPYNLTTGLDPLNTGFPVARPALLGGAEASCRRAECYDLTPGPGERTIGRNAARGPANWNVALRVSRTWAFGREGQSGAADLAGGMHRGDAPSGMALPREGAGGRRYNVTLSASSMNALNRANFGPPGGNLSSPYFGQYRSLGGLVVMSHGGGTGAYNRKIDLQLRFTF